MGTVQSWPTDIVEAAYPSEIKLKKKNLWSASFLLLSWEFEHILFHSLTQKPFVICEFQILKPDTSQK